MIKQTIGLAAAFIMVSMLVIAAPSSAESKEGSFTLHLKVISKVGPIPNLKESNVWLTCRDGDDSISSRVVQITNEMMNTWGKHEIPASCFPEYNPVPPNTFIFFVEKDPGLFNFEKICGGTKESLNNWVGVEFYETPGNKGLTCKIVSIPPQTK